MDANKPLKDLQNLCRYILMPGPDLFTWRRVRLKSHWKKGPRRFLDAGSGNGWFSYLAYRSGATVVAVNHDEEQVHKSKLFYNEWLGIPEDRLCFKKISLYDLGGLEGGFDEIICYETLEHVKDDLKVCQLFWKLLKPGGTLHLCCPYAEHPKWKNEILDLEEKGYHVRAGYTEKSYHALLGLAGFVADRFDGVGGPMLVRIHFFILNMQLKFGNWMAMPFLVLFLPVIGLDERSPKVPFSLYVQALKPRDIR